MTDPHELPRQPIELGDEISNTRFLTGRKAMIDITKPVWTKRGGVVTELELRPKCTGVPQPLYGVETFNGERIGTWWTWYGNWNPDESEDSRDLTHTPPASAAPTPCQECERKQAQITHLEKEVSRLHVANRELSKVGPERRTGR